MIFRGDIFNVALRKESVDRKVLVLRLGGPVIVALRKESVDRKCGILHHPQHTLVALRKESVDRKVAMPAGASSMLLSLSARRAWIEKL